MLASYAWLMWALLAMFSFASNNFLLSAIGMEAEDSSKSAANISGIFVLWLTVGVIGTVAITVRGPKSIISGMKSNQNVMGAVAVGLVNCGAMFALSLALASDPANAGPITAVLPLNAILVAFLAFTFLGEKLGHAEMLGLGVAVSGPVCMALADTSGGALKGLAWGGLTASCFGTSNFVRKLLAKRGSANESIVVVIFVTVGFCGIIALCGSVLAGRGLLGLKPFKLVVFACLSGVLWVAGGICFQYALMGKAGPASAVTNTNSVGVLLLQIAFYGVIPKPLKVLGMALCIAGVTLLSLKPGSLSRQRPTSDDVSVSMTEGLSTQHMETEALPPS